MTKRIITINDGGPLGRKNDQSVSARTIRPQQAVPSKQHRLMLWCRSVTGLLPPSYNEEGTNDKKIFALLPPGIAIINRHEKRHVGNVDVIRNAVRSAFELPYTVPIYYIERTSLEEQVSIWSSVDVAITPHGAQETGLIFLPACGGVLEFLPHGYYYPNYFGSLAAGSGKHHAFLCMSANQSDHSCHHDNVNGPVYKGDWCPPERHIQHGVAILLHQWKECCQNNGISS
jgi:hypothetical protein